jgi:hypothetical protein
MTHLDRVDLESFLNLVDFPLAGVVQYATDPGAVLSGKGNEGILSVSLDDLNQSYSMINIVDIVGMDSVNDALISQMCKALSQSMNSSPARYSLPVMRTRLTRETLKKSRSGKLR